MPATRSGVLARSWRRSSAPVTFAMVTGVSVSAGLLSVVRPGRRPGGAARARPIPGCGRGRREVAARATASRRMLRSEGERSFDLESARRVTPGIVDLIKPLCLLRPLPVR